MTCTEEEVQKELKIILQRVEAGEEVVITRDGEPVARMVGASKVEPKRKPVFGGMRGEFSWVEGWEQPLTEQELKEFYGE